MKKINKIFLLSPIFLAMSSGLTSCGSDNISERLTLKIINSEDYIFLDDENPENDMVEQFKRYVISLVDAGELDEKYRHVEVVYDTSDTNETLYSELQTGKSDYDLINVSDYMAQKMVSEGLVIPLYKDEDGERREDKVPNYVDYASKTLRDRLDNIEAPIKVANPDTGIIETKYVPLKDYAVGYMWGTLGILFNPEYKGFKNSPSAEDVMNDMHYSFSALWNPKYQGSISIKNSMRDTFAAGLMNAYEEDFASLKAQYDDGEIDVTTYMAEYAKVFNGEKETSFETVVNKVQNSLNSLKNNIFGLEVDSGKQDIVTGKIGINLAWSGDAVYSMDQAEDPELVGDNISTLYYCVPELGSNLWFDTWVMPNNANRSEERRELALMFLDFMSDPANAMQNMDYTGYTSFIGGESIVDLNRSWYDVRYSDVFELVDEEEYQVYAYKGEDFFDVSYARCLSTTDKVGCEDYALYYFIPFVDEVTEEDIDAPRSVEELIENGNVVYVKDDDDEPTETPKTYGDIAFADEESSEIDLSYFFNDTFDDDSEYQNNVDTIFYSDSYYADVYPEYDESEEIVGYYCEDEDGTKHPNNSVGRQFFTQYPDEETIARCAVMKDFGENNKLVMKMWEEFKSDPLPTSSLVIFIVIIASGIALGAFIITNKVLVKRIRKKRRGNAQK